MQTTSPDTSDDTKRTPTNAGKFQPGTSGNPHGRPKGSRNRITIQVGRTLAEKADLLAKSIAHQAVEQGDSRAAKVMIDMIAAAEEHEALEELAQMPTDSRAAIEQMAAKIAQLATDGTISPISASKLLDVLQKTAELLPRRRTQKPASE